MEIKIAVPRSFSGFAETIRMEVKRANVSMLHFGTCYPATGCSVDVS